MQKKKSSLSFGSMCPHCHTPHQVAGMRCLNCHKFIWTNNQIILIWCLAIVAAIIAIGLISLLPTGKLIVGIVFAVTFAVVLNRLFK